MHSSRINAFERHLNRLGVFIVGIDNTSTLVPSELAITFTSAMTPEQIALGNAERLTFSWAKRRMLSAANIAAQIATKTNAQQNAILRRFIAKFIAEHEIEVEAFLAEAGNSIEIAYDEVDPT